MGSGFQVMMMRQALLGGNQGEITQPSKAMGFQCKETGSLQDRQGAGVLDVKRYGNPRLGWHYIHKNNRL